MIFYYFFTITWFLIATLNYAEFCYIWQLKEYRLDRFKDYRTTKQGKGFISSYAVMGQLIVLLAILGMRWFEVVIPLSLFLLLLVLETFAYYKKYQAGRFRYPRPTAKAVLIIFLALVLEMTIWLSVKSLIYIFIIFGLRFVFLSLIVWLVSLPSDLVKNYYIYRATEKMKRQKLKVIGITGSYGKTTVKNFLAQTLNLKFKVIATPKNINTEIGVAKFILQTDFSGQEIFIVEMGAYKVNEIKMVCDMVRPTIGVLTAINEQHLSLFGSMENIQSAKYELLFSLPNDGLAITNSDNNLCREWLPKLNCKHQTFGRFSEFKPTCAIKNVKADINGLSFEASQLKINSPVIGEHNAMNIAPCILVAKYLGMSEEQIVKAAQKLLLPPGTLRQFDYGKCKILDDNYNANPDGFAAALKALASYPDDYRKMVITRGMLELGEISSERHEQVGRLIRESADELVLISPENKEDFVRGVGPDFPVKSIESTEALVAFVKAQVDEKVAILLENRVPIDLLKELKISNTSTDTRQAFL